MKLFWHKDKLNVAAGNRSATVDDEQDAIILFVKNKDNVKKAAEGSMNKRLDLLQKAGLRKRTA